VRPCHALARIRAPTGVGSSLDRPLSCLFFFFSFFPFFLYASAISACAHACSKHIMSRLGLMVPCTVNPPGTTQGLLWCRRPHRRRRCRLRRVRQFGQDAPVFAVPLATDLWWPCAQVVPARTITKEWEEAANERSKELKINPITGAHAVSFHSHHTLSASLSRRYLVGRILRQGLRHAQVTLRSCAV